MKTIRSFSFVVLLLSLAACTQYGKVEPIAKTAQLKPGEFTEYYIQPGDELDIKFFYSPELNENITVRPDGRISLQLVDEVDVAGKTAAQLDAELTARYSRKLASAQEVSVIVKDFADQRVYVTGEVARGGELELKNRMTILQAVAAAGGFTDDANRDSVLVVRQFQQEKPQVMLAKLDDGAFAMADTANTYAMLAPRDIIYVPKSGIAKVNLFMDQYVKDTLMFNGFSAGITGVYELNNKDEFATPSTTP